MTLAKAKNMWMLVTGRRMMAQAKAEFQETVDQHFREMRPTPYIRRSGKVSQASCGSLSTF